MSDKTKKPIRFGSQILRKIEKEANWKKLEKLIKNKYVHEEKKQAHARGWKRAEKKLIAEFLEDCTHKGDYYYISVNDYKKWEKKLKE